MEGFADGFTTLSIIDVRGDRWFYAHARMLGIRDGFLFVEEQSPPLESGEPNAALLSTISKIPLDDITRVNIEASDDDADDRLSTTHQALMQSGNLDASGDLTG
jgi:hypothetical protein